MDYRDPFRFSRLISIFFYTSSIDKLLQARYLFRRRGLSVRHFRGSREPYDEDYSGDTRALLAHAVQQVSTEFRVRSCFFIEDTSLRIDSLSSGEDFPGMRVKEWFQSTSFEALDRELRALQSDRRATVKSDIALHIPGLTTPIFLHAETSGRVADSAPDFPHSVPYPWLTPYTFNGWFVPDAQRGPPKRLGQMEVEESIRFDFRAKAIELLLARYIELNAAANLPAASFLTRERRAAGTDQLPLNLPAQNRLIVVIGHKCAGKTTFGDIAGIRDDVQVFEASRLFAAIAADRSFDMRNDVEALEFLGRVGMDAVAIEAEKCIDLFPEHINILTGIRTVEEILFLKRRYSSTCVAYIECDQRIRFERHVRRSREDNIRTFADFKVNDEIQKRFGALRVAREICDIVVTNEESLDIYGARVMALVESMKSHPKITSRAPEESELFRSLHALSVLGEPATCDRISVMSGTLGRPVRRYNTNRALKMVPEFAERLTAKGQKVRYRLTPRGEALLSLMKSG